MDFKIGNLCACMGPRGTDPFCPCEMRNKGLTPTPVTAGGWTPEGLEWIKRMNEETNGTQD